MDPLGQNMESLVYI